MTQSAAHVSSCPIGQNCSGAHHSGVERGLYTPRVRIPGEARRAGLTIAAQSIASLTNFVAVALAQSVSTLEGFGRAFIIFQLTQLLVAVAVGSVGSAILTHTSGDPESALVHDLRAGGARVSVVAGLFASAAFGVAAVFTSSDLRIPLLLAALGAPGLMAQYVLRAMYFGRGRPSAVVVMDTLWLVVVVAAVPFASLTGITASANYYLSAWLLGAAVSGAPLLVSAAQAKAHHVRTFLATTGRQAFLTGLDGLLARTVVVVLLFLTRAFEGEAAVGAVGAAMLPFTPMAVVHTSAFSVAVPATLRRGGIRKISPRIPALVAIILAGASMASERICTPIFSASCRPLTFSNATLARIRATQTAS